MAFGVSYNGVELEVARTVQHVREIQYDQVSGSDYIGTRYLMEWECVYNPEATSWSGGVSSSGWLPPTTDHEIRRLLEVPRGVLIYTLNGIVVLRSPAVGNVVDIRDGPKPVRVQVRQTTQRTWMVRFAVETTINECGFSLSESGLLSNRWETSHATEHPTHLTTIHYRGIAVFRRDLLEAVDQRADQFRDRVLPHIPPWFQRQVVQVRVNGNGTALFYEVVDKEVFRSLGSTTSAQRHGVVDFDAMLTQSAQPSQEGGVVSEKSLLTLQGFCVGDKSSTRASLLTWAVKLGIEKLAIGAGPVAVDQNNLLVAVNLGESVKEPRVHFTFTVMVPPGKQVDLGAGPLKTRFLGVDLVNLFANDGTTPGLPGENVRGHYLAEAVSARLKGACVIPPNLTTVPCAPDGYSDAPLMAPDCRIDVTAGSLSGVSQVSEYSDATTTEGTFTEGTVDTEFDEDTGEMAAPVAGDPNNPVAPVVLSLHDPMVIRVVRFAFQRFGAKPFVPAPVSNDSGEKLVGKPVVRFAAPELLPDGQTRAYKVTGEYRYVRRDGKRIGDGGLPMGAVPWATFPFSDPENIVALEDYRHGYTDPESAV